MVVRASGVAQISGLHLNIFVLAFVWVLLDSSNLIPLDKNEASQCINIFYALNIKNLSWDLEKMELCL
jgi:hypothetical protein